MSNGNIVDSIQSAYTTGYGIIEGIDSGLDMLSETINLSTGENKTINEVVSEKISAFNNALSELGSECFLYEQFYNEYLLNHRKDSKILKERMKEKVIEVINEEF